VGDQTGHPGHRDVTRVAWVLLGGLLLLVLVWLFRRPIALLVISVAISAALAPVAALLSQRLPRGLAVALIFVVLLLLFAGLLWLIVTPLAGQLNELITEAPSLAERAESWAQRLRLPFDFNLRQAIPDLAQRASLALFSVPAAIAGVLLDVGLISFTSLYLLIEAPGIERFFLSLFPAERRERTRNVSHEMLQAMGGYIRGVAINGVIIGTLTYLGLMLIGVDYALVFGILAGLLEFIPIVGPIIASVPVVVVALLQSPVKALLALGFMVLVQQLEGNLVMPHIMRSQTAISPLLALLALSAGGAVGGLVGAIVAIPIAAALHVFVSQVVAPAIRARTGAA
jgi:putative heme transporter